MKPTRAEREFQRNRKDHDFILGQGERKNDYTFLTNQASRQSTPTQHGAHLMRSYHEAQWAQHFERKGFAQAPINSPVAFSVPCYFFEPYGGKRWPSYPAKHHYRIDFVLVYEIQPHIFWNTPRFYAKRWEWVSIKPTTEFADDRRHLIELVQFDSLHQRAMQLCGLPTERHRIYSITYDAVSKTCKTKVLDREGFRR